MNANCDREKRRPEYVERVPSRRPPHSRQRLSEVRDSGRAVPAPSVMAHGTLGPPILWTVAIVEGAPSSARSPPARPGGHRRRGASPRVRPLAPMSMMDGPAGGGLPDLCAGATTDGARAAVPCAPYSRERSFSMQSRRPSSEAMVTTRLRRRVSRSSASTRGWFLAASSASTVPARSAISLLICLTASVDTMPLSVAT